jgi:hypothetical protein
MPPSQLVCFAGIGLLLLCTACDDDTRRDTGGSGAGASGAGGSGSGGNQTGGGPYTLGSLEEPCGPSGITVQSVLERVEPTYATTLKPVQQGASTGLSIGIAYAGGALTCNPPFSTGETGPEVSEQIDVEVDFAFTTDDGAFDEQLTALLAGGVGPFATLTASLPEEQINGTYDPNLPHLYDVAIGWDGQFDGATTTGSVSKGGKKSETVGEGCLVATWGGTP